MTGTPPSEMLLPWHRRSSYEPDAPARGVPQSPRWRVGLVCARMRNFLAGVILRSKVVRGRSNQKHQPACKVCRCGQGGGVCLFSEFHRGCSDKEHRSWCSGSLAIIRSEAKQSLRVPGCIIDSQTHSAWLRTVNHGIWGLGSVRRRSWTRPSRSGTWTGSGGVLTEKAPSPGILLRIRDEGGLQAEGMGFEPTRLFWEGER